MDASVEDRYREVLFRTAAKLLYQIEQRLDKGNIQVEKATKLIRDLSYALSTGDKSTEKTIKEISAEAGEDDGDIQGALQSLRRDS